MGFGNRDKYTGIFYSQIIAIAISNLPILSKCVEMTYKGGYGTAADM